jgi:hypothetical protein
MTIQTRQNPLKATLGDFDDSNPSIDGFCALCSVIWKPRANHDPGRNTNSILVWFLPQSSSTAVASRMSPAQLQADSRM